VLDDIAARAFADSVVFDDWPASHFEPLQAGQVMCWRDGDTWLFRAVVRDDLADPARATFGKWARQRVYMVMHTDDPAADGWFRRRSDHGWQITARAAEMPPDPFV
jgi:hypothetical protein